jgi:dihydroorotate dehydrogenase electron transfer subunit
VSAALAPAPPSQATDLARAPAQRGTIFLESARVLAQQSFEGRQYVLRLHAPQCAAHALPGSFVHLTCDPAIALRRPLSIMRADPGAGSIELLYKVVGHGLDALSKRVSGDELSLIGPIGRGFAPHPDRPRALLVGGGVGIPPMVFLAEWLRQRTDAPWMPLVLMGSEIPFPFRARPSRIVVAGVPAGCIACMPLLEGIGVATRLASRADLPGCFDGFVTELADAWLASLKSAELAQVEIFCCGPNLMLGACAALARRYGVPCQASLEEFMACGVGGCAGCTVLVRTAAGPAMQRVCVDGPVFDALSVL